MEIGCVNKNWLAKLADGAAAIAAFARQEPLTSSVISPFLDFFQKNIIELKYYLPTVTHAKTFVYSFLSCK